MPSSRATYRSATANAPAIRWTPGARTISRFGEGTGARAASKAAPNAALKRNSTVPKISPAAMAVSPRAEATTAVPSPSRSTPNSSAPTTNADTPSAGACELEGGDLQRGHARGREEELAGELGVAADRFDVAQGIDDRVGEPEVLHRVAYLAVLDEPGPVTGHAGDDGLLRVNHVRVVEPRDQETALRVGDHVLDRGVARRQEQVQGEGAVGVRRREGVPGRGDSFLLAAAAVVHPAHDDPLGHEVHPTL